MRCPRCCLISLSCFPPYSSHARHDQKIDGSKTWYLIKWVLISSNFALVRYDLLHRVSAVSPLQGHARHFAMSFFIVVSYFIELGTFQVAMLLVKVDQYSVLQDVVLLLLPWVVCLSQSQDGKSLRCERRALEGPTISRSRQSGAFR